MLDFRRLLYFCTIVEQGQISRAAKKLNISQPTLSLSLKELEDELGLELIHREGSKLYVTKRGQSFYNETQQILSQLDNLSQNIRNHFAKDANIFDEVRIGCSCFCASFLRAVIPAMERLYLGIHIWVLITENIPLKDNVQSVSIDLAILYLPLLYSNDVIIPLKEQFVISVWSPLLPPPHEGILPLKDLAQYPLMLTRRWANSGTFRPFIIATQEESLPPRIILDSPLPSFLLDTLPEIPAVAILQNTELSPIHDRFIVRIIDLPKLVFRPAIIWRKDSYLTPQSNKIIDRLCECAVVPRTN